MNLKCALLKRECSKCNTLLKCDATVFCHSLVILNLYHYDCCWWQCQACGKLDNLEGCMRGLHVSVDSRDKKAGRTISAFLTWRVLEDWFGYCYELFISCWIEFKFNYSPLNFVVTFWTFSNQEFLTLWMLAF